MRIMRRVLPLALIGGLTVLACAAPTAKADADAKAAPGGRAYSAPAGAWSRFQSDLSSAGGLATGQGVTIALLSDGVDTAASGLSGKVTEGPRYPGKLPAPTAHADGTVTASVIVGVPGVLQGAAPDARILDMHVAPSKSAAKKLLTEADFAAVEGPILAKGISYAAGHGARVIEVNEALGGEGIPPVLASAVSDAVAKGVVIVTSAWTDPSSAYLYPAGFPGVIGVASVMLPGGIDPSQTIGGGSADNSSRNNTVLIAGPGDWIQAAQDGWGPYGPSTATPYVAATAALIKQRYPDLSPALVARALAMSARDKPPGGYSTQAGFGILDPYDAVLDAGKLVRTGTTALPGPGVEDATAHFGTGPAPGVIDALPSALPEEIGSAAGIVVGAALLVLAAAIAVRGRRRKRRGPQETRLEQPAQAD